MLIKNCKLIFKDRIEEGSILLHEGKISKINSKTSEDVFFIDGTGLYLSPGFIDIHIHGAGGHDTMEGTYASINEISKTIASYGTTSFLPTTMSCSTIEMKNAVASIAEATRKGTDGANVLGAHLEGPFISQYMVGAQNPKFVMAPSIEAFKDIVGSNISVVKTVTLAPELAGAKELIKYLVSIGIVASAGHTKAKYSEMLEAIEMGLSHSTHLFNAMSPLYHREPGVVGAIFDTAITTETICDGIHIAYPSIRIALKQKSTDKIMLVTDAMEACGVNDGIYSLGGQRVIVKDGAARLENGALAGSILTMNEAVKNVYKNTNYKLYEIIKMATLNGAKHCKVDNRKGQLMEGYDADLILFDEDINIKKVIINGKVFSN